MTRRLILLPVALVLVARGTRRADVIAALGGNDRVEGLRQPGRRPHQLLVDQ